MSRLLLAAAGAVAGGLLSGGSPTGVAVGWSLGSAIGGANDAEDVTQAGPRLTDLRVQTSRYGSAIPISFGRARMAGNVIWSSEIIETANSTSETSGSFLGFGGFTVTTTTYRYTVHLAIRMCEGPIAGVRRIWADGKLIYERADDAEIGTVFATRQRAYAMRIYTGTSTQAPDALIESYEGAGNVPGYRNLAYVVMEDFDLSEFRDQIPNFEFEVAQTLAEVWHKRKATFATHTYDQARFEDGIFHTVAHSLTSNTIDWTQRTFDLTGVQIGERTNFYDHVGTAFYSLAGDMLGLAYIKNGSTGEWWNTITEQSGGAPWFSFYSGAPYYSGTPYYAFDGGDKVVLLILRGSPQEWVIAVTEKIDGLPNVAPQTELVVSTSNVRICTSDLHIWAVISATGPGVATVRKYDWSLNLVQSWDFSWNSAWFLPPIYVDRDVLFITSFQTTAKMWRLNADSTTTALTLADTETYAHARVVPPIPEIIISDGEIFATGPLAAIGASPALSTVVQSLCLRTGLTAGDIDVTALTDSVRGFVSASDTTLRNALEPLTRAYFFDPIESDGKVKFVKRGGASLLTIPAADLDARAWEDEAGDPVLHVREQDLELPVELVVNYFNDTSDYQIGTQYARRLTSNAKNKETLHLPVVLTDDEGKRIANAQLFDAWMARDTLAFRTSLKYARYESGDVVTIPLGSNNDDVRITRRDDGANGVISWEAVRAEASVYTQTAATQAAPTRSQVIELAGPTNLEVLDIPLLRDADDSYGVYIAVAGYLNGWHGAQLYLSSDGGATYGEVEGGAITSTTTIGYAVSTLGTAAFADRWDEANTVDVSVSSGTPTDVTSEQMLGGANLALLGEEILQFRTATLIGTKKYRLNGLLRGRLGTEWAMTAHAMGERFVLLTAPRFMRWGAGDINVERYFRTRSFGNRLLSTEIDAITSGSVNLKPLSPVHLGGGRDAAGNLTINWTRRTRLSAAWRDYVDAPLGESSESYEVDVLNGGAVVRTISSLTVPTTIYTAAQQTTDFGSPQSSVSVKAYQLSSRIGRGYAASATI